METLADAVNDFSENDRHQKIDLVIIWTQTLETITFKIENKHIQFTEQCIDLYSPTQIIRLPLLDKICVDKCSINQKDNTMTFIKSTFHFWPQLLLQPTDQPIEPGFSIQIYQHNKSFDTLDFDLVINSQGQKTGLE
ncbi:hypothetical protein G6F61_000457 [Rhizopus arrhizus]|nr:hypothetical protein G6F61_000457 [Rhizopus arrhizus]